MRRSSHANNLRLLLLLCIWRDFKGGQALDIVVNPYGSSLSIARHRVWLTGIRVSRLQRQITYKSLSRRLGQLLIAHMDELQRILAQLG